MATQAGVGNSSRVVFEFNNTRLILHALQALGLSAKQVLRASMTAGGATFRCEDDGKVCQSSVFFPAGFFSRYEVTGTRCTFGLAMSVFLDALKAFAAFPDVSVRATQHEDRLVLESTEDDHGTAVCMYAHLTVLGPGAFRDLLDNWQVPATEFMISAAILKEAVEDLEWPQGPVRVTVKPAPFSVQLSASSSVGALEIALPVQGLRNTVTQGGLLRFGYGYKFMKTALVGLSGGKGGGAGDVSSRVLIDANGLLKVVHMLGVGAAGGRQDGGAPATQSMATSVVLTYVLQPLFDDEEE